MRVVRVALIIVGSLCGTTPSLVAQGASSVPVGCTYQSCALRLNLGFGRSLVRGAQGEHLSRLGPLGGGVTPLLNGPDSSAYHAAQYVRRTRWSTGLQLAAAAGLLFAYHRDGGLREPFSDGPALAGAFGGIAMIYASIPFTIGAERSLSRAIWWYNAELPR